jgi:hypothetical protein
VTGKYEPLRHHLTARDGDSVELTFTEIAALVDGLPPSAYSSRQWWANSSLTQAEAWRQADRHVDLVDFDRQRVRFARGKVGGSYLARGRRPAVERVIPVLSGEFEPVELDVRVRMRWHLPAGVTLDTAGRLAFPLLPRSAGVYRLVLSGAPDRDQPRVYVGETENLRRRGGNYRRPGPTQRTSQRIHDLLGSHLRGGGTVTMAVATSATIVAGGTSRELSLRRKSARVLAEHAALAQVYLDDDAHVLNRDKHSEP